MLVPHSEGGYQFLPSIEPFSRGVVALPSFAIIRAVLRHPLPLEKGIQVIQHYLQGEGRPLAALCGVELRVPRQFSFQGFVEFNYAYRQALDKLAISVDGDIPMARTNVAPVMQPPAETVLSAFCYTVPGHTNGRSTQSFLVTGTAELKHRSMSPQAVVRLGETTPDALAEKASQVLSNLERRLQKLDVPWMQSTRVSIYTPHNLDAELAATILSKIGPAALHELHWCYSYPPIEGLAFEMDLHEVQREVWVD